MSVSAKVSAPAIPVVCLGKDYMYGMEKTSVYISLILGKRMDLDVWALESQAA
jgi:hypothetical protein